jgi:hypothetical protein
MGLPAKESIVIKCVERLFLKKYICRQDYGLRNTEPEGGIRGDFDPEFHTVIFCFRG